MIINNRHTASGIIDEHPHTSFFQINDNNFKYIVDLYKNSNRKKQTALSDLFSLDFDNIEPLDYKNNKFGFRSPYQYWFNESSDCIWVFGDSITYGHGINREHSWPYLLAQHYNLKLYNFACCGKGIDGAIRILSSWLEKSVSYPKMIVSYGYYRNRFETNSMIQEDGNHTVKYDNYSGPVELDELYEKKVTYFKTLMKIPQDCTSVFIDFISPDNGWHNFYQDFARDIPLEIYDILKNTNLRKYRMSDFVTSSNLPHPGIKSNQAMFEHIKDVVDRKILTKKFLTNQ